MSQQQGVAALFDLVAADYDQQDVEFFQPIADWLVDAVDPQEGESVLDIGCGRGAALLPIAQRVGPTGRASGFDLAPRMVELAGAAAAERGLAVDLTVDDAQAPALEPRQFDAVVSSLVVFFLPDPPAALAAWREMVVPGGRLGFTTFGPYSEHWRALDDLLGQYLPAEMKDPRAKAAGDNPFASVESVERMTSTSGWQDVTTRVETVRPRFRDGAHWYAWSRSVGQRAMWERIPAEDYDRVRDTMIERVDASVAEVGFCGFDQEVRITLARAPG
jgi:ubiquinone/menaquinone biosynthesis C-methylase UbiE